VRPLFLAALSACGLSEILPGRAVLDAAGAAAFVPPLPSPAAYTGPPAGAVPALPIQVFGLFYELDLVLVSQHADWHMHEYARVSTPDGPLWLAKDSRTDRVQIITTDRADATSILANVPVPRRVAPLSVVDRSAGRRVDVRLETSTPAGEPVVVEARGRLPSRPPGARNGNTMGHSHQAVAAALDIARMGPIDARLSIGGRPQRFRRLLGLVPFRFALAQAQAGFAVASYVQRPAEGGFLLERPGLSPEDPVTGAPGWPVQATERWSVTAAQLHHSDGLTDTTVHLVDGGVSRIVLRQHGRADPVLDLWVRPALPDLRRPFATPVESAFRLDVNGEVGHAAGRIRVTPEGGGHRVEILPDAPAWMAGRPIGGTVRPHAGGFAVELRRTPAVPAAAVSAAAPGI